MGRRKQVPDSAVSALQSLGIKGSLKTIDNKEDIVRDKVALITGGGSGIGLEISTQFGQHGALIAIMGRRKQVPDSAVSALQSLGIKVVVVSDILLVLLPTMPSLLGSTQDSCISTTVMGRRLLIKRVMMVSYCRMFYVYMDCQHQKESTLRFPTEEEGSDD
ncbi:hypothetical protein LWI29_015343 [Acer saccharum]|uniref:2,4-dienoyl-CoA reductase [(3E)-enoyl-CoA-producing] n=1 Tax=Acer saccharum TaxID=4024 RepID=A0AA39SVE0_ACESA|nr:hypothetical protein LWI29_015343 [Acer saccharum]